MKKKIIIVAGDPNSINCEIISKTWRAVNTSIKRKIYLIGNFNLIRSAVDRFNKIIISTGASKWQEVLKIANELNKQKIIFMHCVSTYPCPFDKINLKRIIKLKELTNVGYSGHLQGIEDSVAAIC